MEKLTKVIALRVTEAEYQRIAEIAEAEERSIAQVVRIYLKKGLKTN